jgi:hypothetical protein
MEDQLSIDEYQPKILKVSPGDYTYALGISLLSIIPGGQVIASLVGVNQPSPLLKRIDKWMVEQQEVLAQLKESGLNIEDLLNNEGFITVVLQASQVAMRTHQREKLDALRNAVKNSARPNALSDDVKLMFLSFVDTFTVWHLKALEHYRVQRKHKFSFGEFLSNSGEAPNPSLIEPFPGLREQKSFADQVVRDLLNHGLLSTKSGLTITTPFGRQFLAFISDGTP